ncbi:MAG TPA: DALR domain-containing protein, partial [Bacillota bacterium]|nr:DALR domain-containing protein [Bacillota bacterium]
PPVVRLFMLSTHYRSPLDFHDGKLEESQKGLDRLLNTLGAADNILKGWLGPFPAEQDKTALSKACQEASAKFREAMDDDFNTALAVAVLFELARQMNSYMAKLKGEAADQQQKTALDQARRTLIRLGRVLGLFESAQTAGGEDAGLVDGIMELMIGIRGEARAKKDWATADKIRDELGKLGVIIEDTAQGARWKKR